MILQRKTIHTCWSQSSTTYSQRNTCIRCSFPFWAHPPNNHATSWCGTKETAGTQKERSLSPHILPGVWSKPATCRHRHCCCCCSSFSLKVWPQVLHRRVSTLLEILYKIKLSCKTAGILGRNWISCSISLINRGDVYPSDQSSTDTAGGAKHSHDAIWF